MNENDKIFEALGEIDEKYVAEAAETPEKKRSRKIKYIAVGIAAVAVVAVGLNVFFVRGNVENPENSNPDYAFVYSLPKNSGELEKIPSDIDFGSMGFEGYWTYDVREIIQENPWLDGMELTELPVFAASNHEKYDSSREPVWTMDEMEERLSGIAGHFDGEFEIKKRYDGTELSQAYIDAVKEKLEAVGEEFKIEDYYGPSELTASVGSVELKMNDKGEISVKGNKNLLQEQLIPYMDKEFDDAFDTAQNLSAKFYDVIQYEHPMPSIFRDYNFYGEPHSVYMVYDRSDDPLTRLLNFNFRSTSFYMDEGSFCISISDYTPSLSLGMYPIITEEQAFEKLLNGDYVTTVWEEAYLPDGLKDDEVTFCGVYYKRTQRYEYWLPYYKYLVELHAEHEDMPEGMKEFGAYYVPAVRPEYLVDVDTETSFN